MATQGQATYVRPYAIINGVNFKSTHSVFDLGLLRYVEKSASSAGIPEVQ